MKPGDLILVHLSNSDPVESIRGEVDEVYANGAFVKPVNQHGVRLLRKPVWCSDEACLVEEVNGDSLF